MGCRKNSIGVGEIVKPMPKVFVQPPPDQRFTKETINAPIGLYLSPSMGLKGSSDT